MTAATHTDCTQANGNARMPTHSHSVGAQTTYSSASQPQPAAPQRQGQTPAARQGYRTASVQHSAGAAQPPGARHANQRGGFDRYSWCLCFFLYSEHLDAMFASFSFCIFCSSPSSSTLHVQYVISCVESSSTTLMHLGSRSISQPASCIPK